MGIEIGKLKRVYIGIESTPGDPVAASDILAVTSCTLQDKHEPIPVEDAIGNRYASRDSVMGKRWSEGNIEVNLDAVRAGYLLKLAFGNEINTNVATSVYDHNFYPIASGNIPRTATIYHARGGTDLIRVSYATVNSLEISFEDGLVEVSANIIGKFPEVTGISEPSLTLLSGTTFSFRDAKLKFGASLSEAEGASSTSVNSFSLTINNNAETLPSNGDVTTIRTKEFSVEGEYTIFFDSVEERDKFRNLLKKSLIIQFDGMALPGNYTEFVKFRLAKIRLQEQSIEAGLDDFHTVTGSFVAEVDTSQVPNVIDCIVRNNKSTVY